MPLSWKLIWPALQTEYDLQTSESGAWWMNLRTRNARRKPRWFLTQLRPSPHPSARESLCQLHLLVMIRNPLPKRVVLAKLLQPNKLKRGQGDRPTPWQVPLQLTKMMIQNKQRTRLAIERLVCVNVFSVCVCACMRARMYPCTHARLVHHFNGIASGRPTCAELRKPGSFAGSSRSPSAEISKLLSGFGPTCSAM